MGEALLLPCRHEKDQPATLPPPTPASTWHSPPFPRGVPSPGRFDPEDEEGLALNRQQHAKYLHGGLGQLPSGAVCAF